MYMAISMSIENSDRSRPGHCRSIELGGQGVQPVIWNDEPSSSRIIS